MSTTDNDEPEVTDATIVDKAKTNEIAEYSRTEAELAKLREKWGNVAWDVSTPAGDRDARKARKELVTLRTSLEATRQRLKAPALEYSRRLDAEAKRITSAITELEQPIDEVIKADEQRREREAKAKAEEEAARIRRHQDNVAAIRKIPAGAATASSVALGNHIKFLVAMPINGDFEEFQDQAEAARSETLAIVRELQRAALAREADEARRAADQAELERLRAAERERAAAEEAAAAARQRHAEEAAAAEQARRQAELDAQAAALREQEAALQQRIADEEAAAAKRAQQFADAEREAEEREQRVAQHVERIKQTATDMLDALCQWWVAERDDDALELVNARAARDAAIVKAVGKPLPDAVTLHMRSMDLGDAT